MSDFFAMPVAFDPAPDGYDGPVMYEVRPDRRSGRGRFWRPGGAGYTDHPSYAGVYSDGSSVRGSETAYAVPAHQVLACMDTVHRCATAELRATLAGWPAREVNRG